MNSAALHGVLQPIVLSLGAVVAAIDTIPNIYSSIFCLISFLLFLLDLTFSRSLRLKINLNLHVVFFYSLLCFILAILGYFIFGGALLYLGKSFFYIFVLSLLVLLYSEYGARLIYNLFFVLFLEGVLFIALEMLGVLDIDQNIPSAFMVAYAVAIIDSNWRFAAPISSLVVVYSYLNDARAIVLAIVIAVLARTAYNFKKAYAVNFIMVLFLTIPIVSYLISFGEYFYTYEINDALTNRPFIWSLYIDLQKNFWIGSGLASPELPELISEELQYFLGRGVGESYGMHSFFVSQFYRYGFISIILFWAILWIKRSEWNRGDVAMLGMSAVICAFTSVSIGGLYIYSLICTCIFILVTDKRNENGKLLT